MRKEGTEARIGMERLPPSTNQKAPQINLDPAKYGTFVEIGAGQEV